MDSWALFTIAFSAVIVHAWLSRRNDPHWYLGCVVPLLYGGAVAWMFLGDDLVLSLRIILFGAALPVAALIWLWRHEPPRRPPEEEKPAEHPKL